MQPPEVTLLLPSYNTGPILHQTLREALATGLPTSVVIDGSNDGSDAGIEALDRDGRLTVRRLSRNRGKGAAVLHGARDALERGFSHALTLDADGQHPAEAVPAFLELARAHPEALILGRPIFDESAPRLRVEGRKVSNFWTRLETLGWGIDDSLFGMRLYPLEPLVETLDGTRFARRFDFDPEVAVRLAWRGLPVINLPTPVRYPSPEDGGVSQFRYLRDNTLLTWMHLRLLFGFLARSPRLALRGPNPLLHLSPPE